MVAKKACSLGLDLLLLTAITSILVILCWPTIETWQERPRPGIQVCQQHDGETPTNYLLYLPPEYNESRKWPLVVYLHGTGARGQNPNRVRWDGLPRQIEHGRRFNFILLSPQCPADSSWTAETVVKLIEYVSSSLSVDRDRVYLTGYSMGGFGTWQAACIDPGRFAAIAPLCGGGDVKQAKRLTMPIWAFHGEKDQVIPLDVSRAMVDAIRKCGGNVKFTVHPNCGHDICSVTYQDGFFGWLLAQQRSYEGAHYGQFR